MYMTSYPPALNLSTTSKKNVQPALNQPTVDGQLSIDEMLYDPSQPNKVYTFDEVKKKAIEEGRYNLPDSEIQKAVDIMNSQNPQQALADTTLQTPVTQFSAPTTPALDPTSVTANPVTPPAVLEQVPTNEATAAPASDSFTAFYNSQRHPDASKYTDPSLYGKATGNYVPKHLLVNVMFDEKGDIKEQWRDSYFDHKEHYNLKYRSDLMNSTPESQPMLTTGDPSVTAPVSQPMLNPETTTMGGSSPTVVDTAQNEQRLQEMFDGINVAKEGKTGHTGLARESTSTFHKLAMGGMGEKLMRMGAAMNANAHLGGNVMLGAMGQQAAAFNAERLAAEQFQQEQRASALSAYNESIAEQQDLLDQYNDQDRLYAEALEGFDKFSSVTGFFDGSVMKMIDNSGLGNADRQAFRLKLQSIAVDETLLRTAQTKGAISDREMALFRSPIPSLYATEEVWRSWLQARRENMAVIRDRLARGITVASNAGIGFQNTYQVSKADSQDADSTSQSSASTTGSRPSALTTEQNELIAKNLSD